MLAEHALVAAHALFQIGLSRDCVHRHVALAIEQLRGQFSAGDAGLGRAFQEKADQVGAVQEVVALAGAQAGEVEPCHRITRGAVDQLHGVSPGGGRVKLGLQAEGAEDAGAVGRDLQARADLAAAADAFPKLGVIG